MRSRILLFSSGHLFELLVGEFGELYVFFGSHITKEYLVPVAKEDRVKESKKKGHFRIALEFDFAFNGQYGFLSPETANALNLSFTF